MIGRYRYLLWLACIASLLSGGAVLFIEFNKRVESDTKPVSEPLSVDRTRLPLTDLAGFFKPDSAILHTFKHDGKTAFSLAVAEFRNASGARASAVLFPGEKHDGAAFSSSQTGMRHEIWQSAVEAISAHASDDALFLSWWDDAQRIQYLTGKKVWLQNPGEPTFSSSIWRALRHDLIEASADETARLKLMSRWLTIDAEQALREIGEYFGHSGPLYLVVTTDLLLRLSEFSAYGGADLGLQSKNIPAGNNLHGDIAQVKRWAQEIGDGNYLVRREERYYRTWITEPEGKAKNALLIRLLPFIGSLKALPKGVSLVYQSGWGAYLSIYRIER